MPAKLEVAYAAGLPDTTLADGGVWEVAVFTVPRDVKDERVQFAAGKYRQLFGDCLEAQGFEVLHMSKPVPDTRWPEPDPTIRRYAILAWCRRRPQEITVDIPDTAVPAFEGMGFSVK